METLMAGKHFSSALEAVDKYSETAFTNVFHLLAILLFCQ